MGVRTSEPPTSGPLRDGGSDVLTPEEVIIELAKAGRLYVTPSRVLAEALDEAEFFSLWAIAGQITGHEWCSCSLCHEVQLIMPSSKRRCHMTPACHGQMVRIVPRPRMTKALRVALGIASGTEER
jgi:hypothetical protein